MSFTRRLGKLRATARKNWFLLIFYVDKRKNKYSWDIKEVSACFHALINSATKWTTSNADNFGRIMSNKILSDRTVITKHFCVRWELYSSLQRTFTPLVCIVYRFCCLQIFHLMLSQARYKFLSYFYSTTKTS